MRSEKRDRKSQMELSLDSKSASMAESREKIFKYSNSKYLSLFYSRYRRKQSFSENRIQSYRLPMFAILWNLLFAQVMEVWHAWYSTTRDDSMLINAIKYTCSNKFVLCFWLFKLKMWFNISSQFLVFFLTSRNFSVFFHR